MNTLVAPFVCAALLIGAAHAGDSADGSRNDKRPRYTVVKLSSLGGTTSSGNSINGLGLVAGYSNLPGDNNRHATLWFQGFRSELDTLGGPNSNVPWPVKNEIGLVAGIAQTAIPEPLGETWSCRSFFATPTRSGFTCLGVVWERGVIRALPTLGGHNGFATGANNLRQVVGWAENAVDDPSCVLPQRRQFRAVMWGPGDDQVRELPPLAGDSVSAATALNDKGQAVGISGICGTAVGGFSAAHAVLWEKGRVTEIDSLGGVAWNTPMAINERGDVVGFSNVSANDGDTFNAQAFLWTRGRGTRRLGTLEGDTLSQALGINERRQVVGLSCTAGFASCRAFLWEDGVMMDLNELVADDSAGHLYAANDINDRGEIAGQLLNTVNGEFSAAWAMPASRHAREGAEAGTAGPMIQMAGAESSPALLPARVRELLLQQLGLSEARLAQ